MSEAKCPFCGAENSKREFPFYTCATPINKKEYHLRGSDCYERQITTLQAENAQLKERLELWRKAERCIEFTLEIGGTFWRNLAEQAQEALKAAGEID